MMGWNSGILDYHLDLDIFIVNFSFETFFVSQKDNLLVIDLMLH